MQLIKTMIQPLPDHNFPVHFLVRLPDAVCQQRRNAANEAFLQYGHNMVPIIFQESGGTIEISYSVARFLHLPMETIPIRIVYNEKLNRFIIGPILAVLTDQTNDSESPFGSLTSFYEELARYCMQKHLFFYVFSVDDFKENTIFGYTWKNQQWHKQRFPLPNVVYNRIHSRKRETDEDIHMFFQRCQERAIPYFNERFLSKWEIYQLLRNYDEMVPHLPETVLYRWTSDIDSMVQKHDDLFFKPIHGSLGKRIIRLKNDGNTYTIHFSTSGNKKENTMSTTSLISLLKMITPRVKKNEFIIQQGLDIITYENRPLDFRILCNKDENGKWKMTSMVARISAEQQFVSNLARGGLLLPLEKALATCCNPKACHELKRLLMEHSLAYAKIVDQETDGIYGEFGIDLAIDKDGKTWLLEINTKPSKIDDGNRSNQVIRPSAKAIANFALFLSGFQAGTSRGE